MALPKHGWTREQIVEHLRAIQQDDKDWRAGKTFGYIYYAGEEVEEVARDATVMFLEGNGLNPLAFPSVGRMQHDVVEIAADLFRGDEEVTGFMTSGGTESILLAVKGARNRMKQERGITAPEMIVSESAHAAFHKGAEYFGVKVHKVPVRDDWRCDVDAMTSCVNDNTALIVGSAPQYAQGVIDPIADLAGVAREHDINFHVDACMGGWVLPFKEKLGLDVPPWDFRVDGVTSISADIHKLGYAPKGSSVIMWRNRVVRDYQTFLFDDWLGGFYWSSGIQGTKAAAPIAAAWAVLHFLGEEGYCRLVEGTLDAARRMVDGVRAIPGLQVLGEPEAQLVAIAAEDPDRLDVFKVMDVLSERGWHLDRQSPPDSLHATISAGTTAIVDDFVAELRDVVGLVGSERTDDRSTDYAPVAD